MFFLFFFLFEITFSLKEKYVLSVSQKQKEHEDNKKNTVRTEKYNRHKLEPTFLTQKQKDEKGATH